MHSPFIVVNTLPETSWREFVDQHPQGNIFQTPEMFRVFSRAKSHRPELFATVNENGDVLALLTPIQVTLKNGPFHRLTTRSIAYGSLLCASGSQGREALVVLLNAYRQQARREALFAELRHLSDLSAYQREFSACGFAYQAHLNYLIDLNCSREELFHRIGSRTRKHIRRALNRDELVVEQVNEQSQIQPWYELTRKSYEQAQVPLADISLFEAAYDVLHPRNMVKFWLARVGETYVASSVELIYRDVVYGWYGGVDRSYSQFTPMEVLTWHILEWSAENGYRMYDFGGAGNPDEAYGVRDFKAKFGGRLVCYGRNTYVHSQSLYQVSRWGYSLLRRFL